MVKTTGPMQNSLFSLLARYLLGSCLLLVLVLTIAASAQTSSTDGTTPLVLTPGAPAGAYGLSGFDNINLFNGSLNFRLPLLHVGGRGEAEYTVTLPIENHWRVLDRSNDYQEIWLPTDGTWYGDKPGYGPGLLLGRAVATNMTQSGVPCVPYVPNDFYKSLTRLTFILPDGTEYELRDQATGGQAQTSSCSATGYNRGTVFVTADGTAATFVSEMPIYDQIGPLTIYPSGYLSLRNGLRYQINGGKVSWMRDRNGNKLSFGYGQYGVTSINDALNRQVTISYADFQTVFYDQITFKGFGGAQRTIRINYSALSNVLRTDRPGDLSSVQTKNALFPELTGSSSTSYDPYKVSSVVLPDDVQQFQFSYNVYGELARVVLPTGGMFEYDFGGSSGTDYPDGVYFGGLSPVIYRKTFQKRAYRDANTQENKTVFNDGTVDQLDSTGTVLLRREKHYFYGNPLSSDSFPFDYPAWNAGKEYQTEIIDTANCTPSTCATVLRRTVDVWQQGCTVSPWSSTVENNPRIIEADTTLVDTNQVAKQTFAYDCYNNKTGAYEYDFGSGAAGMLVRRSHTDYITATSYTDAASGGASLRSLPSQTSAYDASGIERARTTFEYDNYASDGNHAPLIDRTGISGFDSTFTTSYPTRGNATATTRYLLVNGAVTSSLRAYAQYDIAGNVVRVIDARGYATNLDYTDCLGGPDGNAHLNSQPLELSSVGQASYAFATSATNALGHTSYTQFDYYLGRPVDTEDANGVKSSGYYGDPLDRPTKGIAAVGDGAQAQTNFFYDDTNRVITAARDHSNYGESGIGGGLISKSYYDGLGRTWRTASYEGNNSWIVADKEHDALGRDKRVSNPYRYSGADPANATPSNEWTANAYDALSRVISVTTPDNAAVSTTYSGNTVTVTDQAGKKRKSITDGLGRLREVYEDPVGLNYLTSYSYDVLDNLTSVSQGVQTRSFVYDSLNRLSSATNPESGTISYSYDDSGNLTQKADSRGVVSNYVYDALNRVTSRSYSDGTPAVTYAYDTAGIANSKGRLTSVSSSVSTYSYSGYDPLGRASGGNQMLGNQTYTFSYGYDLAGHVKTITYPSGRTVNYAYDTAGRANSVTGNLGDGSQRNYATGIIYDAASRMSKEQFGTDTPVYNKLFYNSRGQLSEIRESTSYTGLTDTTSDRGAIINHYSNQVGCSGASCNATDNNGNLMQQEVSIPNSDTFAQFYEYDSLNRLELVRENRNGGAYTWQQAYTYDRHGNRRIDTDPSRTWGGVNNLGFELDTGTNRLYAPGDLALLETSRRMQYDSGGNLKTDTYSGAAVTRSYDAENRMTSETQANYLAGTYTYDGDGRRVKRLVGGTETWQVYGMDGELLAEYPANVAAASPTKEYGYRNGQLLITSETSAAPTPTPTPLAPPTYYQAATDFSSVQGQKNWYYLDSTGAQMNFDAANNRWQGAETWLLLYSFWGHPGQNVDAVRQWRASQPGTIRITGTAADGDPNCGDGVVVSIKKGSQVLWQQTIANGNAAGFSYDLTITVATGDQINFVINKGSANNACDGTYFNPEITYLSSTYNAFTDFSGVQGARSWYYLDSTGAQMNFDAANNRWQGAETWLLLYSFWGHPGQNVDAVRQWRAPTAGTIRITGPVADGDPNCGDGVVVSIKKGSQVLWQQTIANGNTAGFSYDLTTTVATGDQINFVINRGSDNNWCDGTYFNPTVSYTGGSTTANINWLVTDQLGTPRIIIDKTGALANVKRHDYLPFGEELFASQGGRTTGQGYVADNLRQKFTRKERDNETGLDYFLARYYSSIQGRFTGADPDNAGAETSDPQSWNGYAYVGNAPLTSTDPFGLWKEIDCTSGKGKCWESDNKNDTISSLAKILNLSAKDLNKFFQNPTIHIGNTFDVSGVGLGNIPTIRDSGPAFVQVFLVADMSSSRDKIAKYVSYEESTFRAARWDKIWYQFFNPCDRPNPCQMGIFYSSGLGGLGRSITFSGAGQAIGHGARHLVEIGVSQEAVESAIVGDIQTIQGSASRTGSFWGRVNVQGHTILYKAYTLPDGTINVGTYYKPSP